MGDERLRVVAIANRVRRARHRLCDAESPARATDERRLPGTELTVDGDDVTGLEVFGQVRPDALGPLRRLGDDAGERQKSPSCAAGSGSPTAAATSSGTFSGSGSASRPRSSGSRPTSSSSTVSMLGV